MSILSKIEEIRKIQKEIDIYYLETENNYSPQRNIIYKALWKLPFLSLPKDNWRQGIGEFRFFSSYLSIFSISLPIVSHSLSLAFLFLPLIFYILIPSFQKSFDGYIILNLLESIEKEDYVKEGSTLILYQFLSLKKDLKLDYTLRKSKETRQIIKVINNIIDKLSILNKKEKKQFSLLKNNNEERYFNKFKNFQENQQQLYVNEEDIIEIFEQKNIDLSFIITNVNLELKVVQRYISLIKINKESLTQLIDRLNTDYYKKDLELFFSFVTKEQIEEDCYQLIDNIIGAEKTQKIINMEKDNRTQTNERENKEKSKTLKMNGKSYE